MKTEELPSKKVNNEGTRKYDSVDSKTLVQRHKSFIELSCIELSF